MLLALLLPQQSTLQKLTNKQVIIMGDFSINLPHYDEYAPTNECINNLFSYNFLPCINHITRISENSSTIIENIFINLFNANVISGNILFQISDQLPQFLIMKNGNIPQHNFAVFKSD